MAWVPQNLCRCPRDSDTGGASERDNAFRELLRGDGLDRDPDNVLGRVQRFDDQDAAGFRIGSNHCSVLRRGLGTAACMGPMAVVASTHSGRLGYLLMAHWGTRLVWDR